MSELMLMELILASGALGIQAPRVRRLARQAKLRLFVEPESAPQLVRMGNLFAMVYSIRLGNVGGHGASSCRAQLERIEYWNGAHWQSHPGFGLPLPLSFHAMGTRSWIELTPGSVSDDLPLVYAFRGDKKLRVATPLQIVSGILLEYPAGRYRFTVRAHAEGRPEPSATRRFEVGFDGDWETIEVVEARGPEQDD